MTTGLLHFWGGEVRCILRNDLLAKKMAMVRRWPGNGVERS
jgi:hypothetical protein